jgi:two-component system NtrC family sensor kinase
VKVTHLRTRLLLGSIGLVILLAAGLIFFIQTTLSLKLTEELQKRGVTLARDFTQHVVDPILTENSLALQITTLESKNAEEDIEYEFVLNAKGEVLAHTFGETFPSDLRRINVLKAGQAYGIQPLRIGGKKVFDIAVPILKGELGTTHLGISAEPVRKSVRDIINLFLKITLGLLIVGSSLAFFSIMSMTKPFSEFMKVASEVGAGDLSRRVTISTNDEIGELAGTFNKMVSDLQKTTVSRSQLETVVEERTAELSASNLRLQEEINERRRAEGMLATLSRQNKLILQSAGEGIYGVDLNGRVTFLNPAASRMLGWEFEEILSGPAHDVMHHSRPDGTPYPKDDCLVYAAYRDGKTHHVTEEVFWRKDGTSFPVAYVSTPIMEDGAAVGAVVIFRDVSERKKAEENLQLFSKAIEEAMDGVQITDLNGLIMYSNKAVEEIYGFSASELVGRRVNELNVDKEFDRAVIIPAMEKTGRWNGELMAYHKNGRTFPIWLSASMVNDDKGRPMAMVGIIRDITSRKEVEDELRRHRESLEEMVEEKTVELRTAVQLLTQEIAVRKNTEKTLMESEHKFRRLSQEFHTLLDAIPDTLILLSPDLRVMWTNKGGAAEFGRGIAEITGRHCYELWHGRSTVCDDCHARRSFETGQPEITQRSTRDGRLLDSKSFPIMDEEGRVNNVILIVSDVTEKTTLQAEAMRASHLASLGELAAGVAHEINNPINGIINYAQLIANRSAGESREYDIATRIIKEGDRISGIVRSLLSFARERREEKVSVGIQKIMDDTITLMEAQIRKDGVLLKLAVAPDLPEIFANPQQIQQVFLNIISNSRYALNKKYPGVHEAKVLEISARRLQVDSHPYLRVTFYDRGCGIPADIIDKVMNPFFSTKPSGHGTGLGLSISHGLVKDHGGRLMLQSKEGSFTRVMVDLPAREKDAG